MSVEILATPSLSSDAAHLLDQTNGATGVRCNVCDRAAHSDRTLRCWVQEPCASSAAQDEQHGREAEARADASHGHVRFDKHRSAPWMLLLAAMVVSTANACRRATRTEPSQRLVHSTTARWRTHSARGTGDFAAGRPAHPGRQAPRVVREPPGCLPWRARISHHPRPSSALVAHAIHPRSANVTAAYERTRGDGSRSSPNVILNSLFSPER